MTICAVTVDQHWALSWRADPAARVIADRHYNRQKVGTPQFVKPGRCLVLTAPGPALWVTSWPLARYVKHAWPGAWECATFRREGGQIVASEMILAAVAATRWRWPDPPDLGMVTFVDPAKTRPKRDPGWCYLKAGFVRVGTTAGGLVVLQLRPNRMPPPHGSDRRTWLVVGRGGRAVSGRPVQLGLIEGSDKAVGPMLTSVISGNNADLIAAIAPLYLTGNVLDTTYGRGMWWRRFTPDPFAHHDVATDGVDFRELPYDASTFDTVCFDPPYVPRQGPNTATMRRDQDFRDRFGLDEPRTEQQLRALINDGLSECARVARRWLLVKANDYTNGRQFHLGHVRIINHAQEIGLRVHDLIVHASGSGPGGGQITEVRRARRAHSYLIVLRAAK